MSVQHSSMTFAWIGNIRNIFTDLEIFFLFSILKDHKVSAGQNKIIFSLSDKLSRISPHFLTSLIKVKQTGQVGPTKYYEMLWQISNINGGMLSYSLFTWPLEILSTKLVCCAGLVFHCSCGPADCHTESWHHLLSDTVIQLPDFLISFHYFRDLLCFNIQLCHNSCQIRPG